MSNTDHTPDERDVHPGPAADVEILEPREVPLGGPRAMLVRRSLPGKTRHLVGPWCFADAYGPTDLRTSAGMQVPPHPHIGLQTVTWLLAGEVAHTDSLGSSQLIRPGQLNLMTAGRGIAHAEISPAEHSAALHGVQLWVALPEEHRRTDPLFDHHADLPTDGHITVLMGRIGDLVSPARTFSPLVGAEIALDAGQSIEVPLDPDFEHAVLAAADPVSVEGHEVPTGAVLYLGLARRTVTLRASTPTRVLLLGGEPFGEPLVMWWNFVARDHDEIVEARTDWERERTAGWAGRFGAVTGYDGAALPAPPLPNLRLRPRK